MSILEGEPISLSDSRNPVSSYESESIATTATGILHSQNNTPSPQQGVSQQQGDKKTMEGVKLFVGSLPKGYDSDSFKNLFAPYGTVIDVYLLVDRMNKSDHDAGFIRLETKVEAESAIAALDKQYTIPGATRPIQVRIADNQGDNGGNRSRNFMGQPQQNFYGFGQQQPQQIYRFNESNQQPQPPTNTFPPQQPQSGPRTIGLWTEYHTSDGKPYYYNASTQQTTWDAPPEFKTAAPAMPQPVPAASGTTGGSAAGGGYGSAPGTKGPPGANIFVFHVPNTWDDQTLYNNFAPYGNILSAKVIVDPASGTSKGYAFVSYETANSAASAIQSMNGFIAGDGRRLKVSIKKGEEMGVSGGNSSGGTYGAYGNSMQPYGYNVPY